MKIKGIQEPSIVCKSGIRQACPLSPLLLVIVVDLLLRKLALHVPEDVIRAFADDTAIIMPDFPREANRVLKVFTRFATVSDLKLDIPKNHYHTFMGRGEGAHHAQSYLWAMAVDECVWQWYILGGDGWPGCRRLALDETCCQIC